MMCVCTLSRTFVCVNVCASIAYCYISYLSLEPNALLLPFISFSSSPPPLMQFTAFLHLWTLCVNKAHFSTQMQFLLIHEYIRLTIIHRNTQKIQENKWSINTKSYSLLRLLLSLLYQVFWNSLRFLRYSGTFKTRNKHKFRWKNMIVTKSYWTNWRSSM